MKHLEQTSMSNHYGSWRSPMGGTFRTDRRTKKREVVRSSAGMGARNPPPFRGGDSHNILVKENGTWVRIDTRWQRLANQVLNPHPSPSQPPKVVPGYGRASGGAKIEKFIGDNFCHPKR